MGFSPALPPLFALRAKARGLGPGRLRRKPTLRAGGVRRSPPPTHPNFGPGPSGPGPAPRTVRGLCSAGPPQRGAPARRSAPEGRAAAHGGYAAEPLARRPEGPRRLPRPTRAPHGRRAARPLPYGARRDPARRG
ncbi:hypothetical protein GCM10022245_27580 [Streptomyces mayteni]